MNKTDKLFEFLEELANDDDRKAEVISDMATLLKSKGWAILRLWLDKAIEEIEKNLLEIDDLDMETIKLYKQRRKALVFVRDLPRKIIDELKGELKTEIALDPYE